MKCFRALFERFTERARQVVVLAHEEARALSHNYIGTEHILLGLVREEQGLAARILESLDITAERVRAQVVRIVVSGDELTAGQIPFTPRAKKVLELALHDALSLGHNYIGTEHILLGLVRESDGVAVRILLALDADAEKIRSEVIRMLSGPEAREQARSMAIGSLAGRQVIDRAWFGGLGAVLDDVAAEIRGELRREPDTGDLVLVLACAPDTLAAQLLRELGVDLDGLPSMIERIRTQRAAAEAELAQRIEEVRQGKNLAIESREFEAAARMRDHERELTQQQRARAAIQPEVLQEFRKRLGISGPTDAL